MTIWIVFGIRGEYSDRTEWVVRAFLSQRRAEKYAQAVKSRSAELRREYGGWVDVPDGANELDPSYGANDVNADHVVGGPYELDEDPE